MSKRIDTRASASYCRTDKVQGFVGRVTCWENGKRLWSESTGIFRYTQEDATIDAEHLEREIIERNAARAVVPAGWDYV